MRIAAACMLGVAVLAWAGSTRAKAETHIVWGQVTQVQPLTEERTPALPDRCFTPRPDPAAGLAALLAWDLQPVCVARQHKRILGYRVEYRWDGRTYTQIMDEDPGQRVPLLLKIRDAHTIGQAPRKRR